jgi:autophagy-related protein 2
MNFFHFEGAEMVLRHITLRGINGWDRLFNTLQDIWTPDVKANQLADVLSGMAPIRSLVNVGAGLADLVLLPIEQYNKDGRVLRGVQKGATSFAKSTALEAVKLGARLATGTQVFLEQAEHILGGQLPESIIARAVGPETGEESYESLSESMMLSGSSVLLPHRHDPGGEDTSAASVARDEDAGTVSRYAAQPEDMRDALSQAYTVLSKGLTSAAQTILAIPMEVYEPSSDPTVPGSGGGGYSGVGAGRPVVKAIPIAILRGARGATGAIAKTMQGVQATLGDQEAAIERKYKQIPQGRKLPPTKK